MTFEQAAAIWAGTTGTIVPMSKWLWAKTGQLFDDFATQIDERNADLGCDTSVDPEEIALDFLTPFGGDSLEKYANRNGIPRGRYVSELRQGVGWPYRLALSATLFTALLAVAFSAPLIYRFLGLSPMGEYFAALYAVVFANLIAYFIL
jgi:hypothetical protein